MEGALLPLNEIAFYHGIQHGFYFAFLTTFTAFLLPLALVGLGVWIYNLFETEMVLHRRLLPFTCLFTSIWLAIFFQAWKRKEKTLAFQFQTLDAAEIKTECKDFSGRYEFSNIQKKVIQTHKFGTVWRRLIWEFPTYLIFGAAAVILTLLLGQLTDKIDKSFEDKLISQTRYDIYTFLNSNLEAATMLTLNMIYDKVCSKLVFWENHR